MAKKNTRSRSAEPKDQRVITAGPKRMPTSVPGASAGPTNITNGAIINASNQIFLQSYNPEASFAQNFSACGVDANRFAPCLAAEALLANTLGSLPCQVFRKEGNTLVLAEDHPLYNLLCYRPSPNMSRSVFFSMCVKNMIRFGNAFAYIVRRNNGEAVELRLLDSSLVAVKYRDGYKYYEYSNKDGKEIIEDADMLHFIGATSDGFFGEPLLMRSHRIIELANAIQMYNLRFMASGQVSRGIVKMPVDSTDEQLRQVKANLEQAFSGGQEQWRTPILGYGAEWIPVALPNDSSCLLELKRDLLLDVARIYNVPAGELQDLNRVGLNSLESQSLSFITKSLRMYIVSIELELSYKLPVESERYKVFAEFDYEDFSRADTTTRYNNYAKGIANGFLNVNEVRQKEYLCSIGPEGDVYLSPLNMKSAAANDPTNADGLTDPNLADEEDSTEEAPSKSSEESVDSTEEN